MGTKDKSKSRKQHLISKTSRSWTEDYKAFVLLLLLTVPGKRPREKDACNATFGTLLAVLEVLRTINRADLWAFTMALSELIGPSTIRVDKWTFWMVHGDERKVVLGQNKRMPTCG